MTVIFLTTRLLTNPRAWHLWLAFSISAFIMIFTRSIGLVPFACAGLFLLVAFLRRKPLRRALLRGAAVVISTFLVMLGGVFTLTPVKPADLLPARYLGWYGIVIPTRSSASATPAVATPRPPRQPAPVSVVNLPRVLVRSWYAINDHIYNNLRRMLTLTGGGGVESALAVRLGAPSLPGLPGVIVLALLALGNARWWHATRRSEGITVFQAIALVYIAIAISWSGGGERLFYPIQPQLYFAALLGVHTCWRSLLRAGVHFLSSLGRLERSRFALEGLTVLVCGWLLLALYRDFTLPTSYRAWGDLTRRTEWAAANLPPDAVVLSDWPVRDYLVTGLETIQYPGDLDTADQFVEFLRQRRATHILVALDGTLETTGIAPDNDRVDDSRGVLRELTARGVLVQIHSDPFPVLVLRVAP